MIGKTLGTYEILSPLGKGGMGEVWRARDSKLGREVAIKTLPEEFAQDGERLARFEREAKLLASLNHPNIATIHGLEEDHGTRFLVLELVEGDTLADRLKRGAIPVEESLKLALQIAEALEAAHEKGVIHRDLKPANVKVTPDGKVKVLDFGLAKAFAGDGADANLSQSPTMSMAATQQGVILGTAAYMSPEQAAGLDVGKGSDIWAFGVVLFEMMTGRAVFAGETAPHILASVLKTEPDWNSLPPNLHPGVRVLLERSLEKEASDRWHDIADVRVDIQRVLADPGGVLAHTLTTATPTPLQSRLSWVVSAVLAAALVTAIWFWPPDIPPAVSRYLIAPPAGQLIQGPGRNPVFSDDGRSLIYPLGAYARGRQQLYSRPLDRLEAVPLSGTEGAANTFVSPDGQRVGFNVGRELRVVAVTGGEAVPLVTCETGCRGASWFGNQIVFGSARDVLYQVPATGGATAVPISQLNVDAGEISHYYPKFLPDGKAVLYTSWVGALSSARISVLDVDTGISRDLGPGSNPSYVSSGHLVYAYDGSLWAAPFDSAAREITGGAVPVVPGIWVNSGGLALYAVGADGSLAYVPGTANTGTSPGWLRPNDNEWEWEPFDIDPASYSQPRISPGGESVALRVFSNINVYEPGRGLSKISSGINDGYPVWSPDGTEVAFMSDDKIVRVAANGTGDPQLVLGTSAHPYSWSSADELIVGYTSPDTGWNVGVVRMGQNDGIEALLESPFDERSPSLSPDGRWLAYVSNRDGQEEIYVRPFPAVNSDRRKISTDGGTSPLWAADSSRLYYRRSRGVMEVAFRSLQDLGTAEPLRTGPFSEGFDRRYDISPIDGRFVLLSFGRDRAGSNPLVVVENWVEELRATFN